MMCFDIFLKVDYYKIHNKRNFSEVCFAQNFVFAFKTKNITLASK